jgi:hypothetical protein
MSSMPEGQHQKPSRSIIISAVLSGRASLLYLQNKVRPIAWMQGFCIMFRRAVLPTTTIFALKTTTAQKTQTVGM